MKLKPYPLLLAALLTCSTLARAEAQAADSNAPAASITGHDYLGAVGIGVSDLKASTAFYGAALGLEVLRSYELGYLNEIVLGYTDGDGAVLVLMNWPEDTARRYDGTNVKNVFYVDDPAGVMQRIRELGGTIDREATPHPAVNGRLVGLGRDPDNYVIEVLQRQ